MDKMFGCYLATAPTFDVNSDECWKTRPTFIRFESDVFGKSPEEIRLQVNKLLAFPKVIATYGGHCIPEGKIASEGKVITKGKSSILYHFEIREVEKEKALNLKSLSPSVSDDNLSGHQIVYA